MPREKEEVGYATSNWYSQNMGFPEFLESLSDEPVDHLESGPSVEPKRLFEFASLNKAAEDSMYSLPNRDSMQFTTPDQLSDTSYTTTEAPAEGKTDTTERRFIPAFKQALDDACIRIQELLNKGITFFETEPYSALNKAEVINAVIKTKGVQNLALMDYDVAEENVIPDIVKNASAAKPVYNAIMAKFESLPAVSPKSAMAKAKLALTRATEAITEIIDANDEAHKAEFDALYDALFTAAGMLKVYGPFMHALQQSTIDVDGMLAYDHNMKATITVAGKCVKLGSGKYAYQEPKSQSVSEAAEGGKGSWKDLKQTVTDIKDAWKNKGKTQTVEIDTTEAFDKRGNFLSILTRDIAKTKSGKRTLPKGTEVAIVKPDSDEAKKYEKAGIEIYHILNTDTVILSPQGAGTVHWKGVPTKIHSVGLASPIYRETLDGDAAIEIVYIRTSDFSNTSVEATMHQLANTFKIFADMFTSPMPGAWREYPESGSGTIETSPIDREKPFKSQPQRGAVPYISMPNVGDGLRGNDNSIEKGVAEDAEYADKEIHKTKEAYARILAMEKRGTDLYKYAEMRFRKLQR